MTFDRTSAIAIAAHDLAKALSIGNDADPRTRKHVLDAVTTLADAFGISTTPIEEAKNG